MAQNLPSRGRSTHVRTTRAPGSLAAAAAAVALGALAGLAATAVLARAAAGDANDRPTLEPGRLIDATHLPPLLTKAGEGVELRYDIYCTAPDGDPESGAPCDAGGTVFVRRGESGAFSPLPLRLDRTAAEGRYVASVPRALAAAPEGFSYYAVVRDGSGGASLTLPAGGAEAPQQSVPLGTPVTVELGRHTFGAVASPSERVFSAPWGRSGERVGLEGGRETRAIGPSAFDVAADGTVTLLDQVNRRLVRIGQGGERQTVPVAVDGMLADMSVDEDGTAYVLESTGEAAGGPPVLRTFDAGGRARPAVPLAERTASQVRVGPGGPVVKVYPSEVWMQPSRAGRAPERLTRPRAASPGRKLRDGREVRVLVRGDELRLALDGPGGTRRSWIVTSGTPLGEVQLAEPYGNGLAVVLRLFTDDQDEFQVLVLGPRGVERRFALASQDWAETAPLTRFRLAGRSLYRLGSTPAGLTIDRFELEVS